MKDAVPIPIDDLFYTRSVRGAAWSPDGKQIVFTTNLTGRFNLWKVISETSATWSPDGKSLGIRYKPKASPSTDIAVLDWSTHAVRNLTQEKSTHHLWSEMVWSPDRSSLLPERRARIQ